MADAGRYTNTIEHGRSFFFCFRCALCAAGSLRLVALSKRGRVSLARGQLQVHVCTWLHRAELRGRHQRVRQEPVQTRRLQEHSRILQVSRMTLLNGSLAVRPTLCVSLSRNVLGDDYTTTTTTDWSEPVGIRGHFYKADAPDSV